MPVVSQVYQCLCGIDHLAVAAYNFGSPLKSLIKITCEGKDITLPNNYTAAQELTNTFFFHGERTRQT